MDNDADVRRALLWMWLAEVLGPCNPRLCELLRAFPYIEELYSQRETVAVSGILTPAESARARKLTLDVFERSLAECKRNGVSLVVYADEEYPERLRRTSTPPALLYVTGDVSALADRSVGGVGSRNPTRYGRDAVKRIAGPLAKYGFTLVSGMAAGIDSEIHRAALDNGARTVAVLGTGIDTTYPSTNRALRKQIEENGAVVSEYPPGSGCERFMFPQRNRIITGLSMCVIIFEAAKKSGTMITANWALEDSRDVFAVPGSIFSEQSEGTNGLIAAGATPALSADDIFRALGVEPEKPLFSQSAPTKGLDGIEKEIYDFLKREGDSALDGISEATDSPVGETLSALSAMEIAGLVEALPGMRYAIKN